MIGQFKIYLIIGAILFASFGGWKVRGWYEGNKEKEVIEKEVEVFNEQTLIDHDRLLEAEIELDNYKNEIDNLKGKAYAINKGICNSADSYKSFSSLYNQAIEKANQSHTSKLSR